MTETQIKTVHWHAIKLPELLARLHTNAKTGLSENQVHVRQRTWGRNVLPQAKKTPLLLVLLRQFQSPLVYILLIAALLTWWLREFTDMTVILLVVAINAGIGFFQEYRASKIFETLKRLVQVEAIVIRGGQLHTINAEELVPGDLIVLKSGRKVPADARVLSATDLTANESLLTGESKAVNKLPGQQKPKTMISDQSSMVFMGTVLEDGEGRAVVVKTGARTEIGRITLLTQSAAEEVSPLQIRMGKLGQFLSEMFVVIAAAILIVGLMNDRAPAEMIKTTIAVAVAAIPEGLPAAISVILAIASQRVLKRKGLVRKLVAAETLGSTAVICTDKTGTLTYGQMRVEKIIADRMTRARLAMALANEAIVEQRDGKNLVKGEATDKAKLESFLNAGGDLEQTLNLLPRLALLPFDPMLKLMASLHRTPTKPMLFVCGAPEAVIQRSKLPAQKKQDLKKLYEQLARKGYRLIAMAEKSIASQQSRWSRKELVGELDSLTYTGLAAIRDPIREDVQTALSLTRQAGIKVLMITGDHILTAKAIGAELGFATKDQNVITGEALDQWSKGQLTAVLPHLEIIARATPEHKMRIIDAWQEVGRVVAMTGDGVNDAPALKSADIGIAVGSGTDVSREASDLVLLNDSFSTITAAVEEGRTGFANIKKATVTVMANAFSELTLIASSLVLALPFPITAVQILWVNIVTDSLPVLSLAFEPSERGIMKESPNRPTDPILDKRSKAIILVAGFLADLILVGIFWYLLTVAGWELLKIQSLIFLAIALPTLLNVFAYKSLRESLFKLNLFNNRLLVIAVLIGLATMLLAIYLPALNRFLGTTPLTLVAVLVVVAFALFKLTLVELVKWRFRKFNK